MSDTRELHQLLIHALRRLDAREYPPAGPVRPWAEWCAERFPEECRLGNGRHGTVSGWRAGCRQDACREANRISKAEWRAKQRTPVRPDTVLDGIRPRKVYGSVVRCACGHAAPSVWELAGHTLDVHGRPPTPAEREPQRTEVAA